MVQPPGPPYYAPPSIDLAALHSTIDIPVGGAPWDWTKEDVAMDSGGSYYHRYGVAPEIVAQARPRGGLVVAWNDYANRRIAVTWLNAAFAVEKTEWIDIGGPWRDTPTYNRYEDDGHHGQVNFMSGFTLTSWGYAYSFVNNQSRWDQALKVGGQLTVVGVNAGGGERFRVGNVLVDDARGELPMATVGSKVSPCGASTGRLAYDGRLLAVTVGHLMLSPDGVRHQGGFVRYLGDNGAVLPQSDRSYRSGTWWGSHNFDQRVAPLPGSGGFVFAGLGDAYPRALFLGTSSRLDAYPVQGIPGKTGDNETGTELGGLVIRDAQMAVSYTTNARRGSDVRDTALWLGPTSRANGAVPTSTWLTAYPSNTYAIDPKAAAFGPGYLVAWKRTVTGSKTAMPVFAVVDPNGSVLAGPTDIPHAPFQRPDDFVTLANGDVVWVVGTPGRLEVHRIRSIGVGYVPPPVAVPSSTATGPLSTPSPYAPVCRSDAECGTFRCNLQVGRCVMPCLSTNDCGQRAACLLGACVVTQ